MHNVAGEYITGKMIKPFDVSNVYIFLIAFSLK
jgi:hypothetical protein